MAGKRIQSIYGDLVDYIESSRQESETFCACLRRLLNLPALERKGKIPGSRRSGRPSVYKLETMTVGEVRKYEWHPGAGEGPPHPIFRAMMHQHNTSERRYTGHPKPSGVYVTRTK